MKIIALAALLLTMAQGWVIKSLERRVDEAHLALLCVSLGGRPGMLIGEVGECSDGQGKLWGKR